ncbi:MAG: universal stress protein [Proteobacteria bacterium]|nr:universal stress protein [Pseudomonadota bacterium]
MNIRTILVPLAGGDDMKPVMELGLTIGRDIGAHVDVLHVRSDPKDTIPLLGEGMSVSMIEDMIQITEKEGSDRAAKGRQVFDEIVGRLSLATATEPGGLGPTAAWGEEIGRDDEVTARRGRLADLIVVGRPTKTSDVSLTLTLNAALFDSGRPVLVAPPGGAGHNFGGHIGISWNGSAQSARAVGSAMGLIAGAGKVTVLTAISDQTSAARGPELAAYLEWHGVTPETRNFTADGQSIGSALLAECEKAGVDMLVMGAYTHSRMRQSILGGVTRHVLEEASIPLFMAH